MIEISFLDLQFLYQTLVEQAQVPVGYLVSVDVLPFLLDLSVIVVDRLLCPVPRTVEDRVLLQVVFVPLYFHVLQLLEVFGG